MSTLEGVWDSNRPLTDSEVETVLTVCNKARDWTTTLEAEIDDIQKELDDLVLRQRKLLALRDGLREQCDTNAEVIRSHKALLTMRRMPPELIQHIFIMTLPEPGVETPSMRITEVPLKLTRVCSLWRALAFNTPELWDSLAINWRPERWTMAVAEDRFAHRVEAARSWLARAHPRPLNIVIDAEPIVNWQVCEGVHTTRNTADVRLEAVIGLVLEFVESWGRFDIWNAPELALHWLKTVPNRRLPFLESFVYVSGEYGPYPQEHLGESALSFLSDAPKLQRVCFKECGWSRLFWQINLPWNQVTELDLCYDNPVLDIIRQCHQLEVMNLSRSDRSQIVLQEPVDVRPIELNKLHTLQFCHPGLHIWQFFNRAVWEKLRLPSLRNVHIELMEKGRTFASLPFVQSLKDVVVRSNCSLKTLTLDAKGDTSKEDARATAQAFADLLVIMPDLEEFKIVLSSGKDAKTKANDALLSVLLPSLSIQERIPNGNRSKSHSHLPSLKSFCINHVSRRSCQPLLSFLQSRFVPTSDLQDTDAEHGLAKARIQLDFLPLVTDSGDEEDEFEVGLRTLMMVHPRLEVMRQAAEDYSYRLNPLSELHGI